MIDECIIELVEDLLDFQESELGRELKDVGAPPYERKYLKLITHRRAGFTTAALDLLERYPNSLIVTGSESIRRMMIDMNNEQVRRGMRTNKITSNDNRILPEWKLHNQWFLENLNVIRPMPRYRLIILDPAGIIERNRIAIGMNYFRDQLFMLCDALVELE